MSLPIKGSPAEAVVIDQGRDRATGSWHALQQALKRLERNLRIDPTGDRRPNDNGHRPGGLGSDGPPGGLGSDGRPGLGRDGRPGLGRDGRPGLGRDGHRADGGSTLTESFFDRPGAEQLFRQLRDLGRKDLAGLKQLLRDNPRLAAELEAALRHAAQPGNFSGNSGLYAGHGLAIPNDDGWA